MNGSKSVPNCHTTQQVLKYAQKLQNNKPLLCDFYNSLHFPVKSFIFVATAQNFLQLA